MRTLSLWKRDSNFDAKREAYKSLVPGEILMIKAYDDRFDSCGFLASAIFAKVHSTEAPIPVGFFRNGTMGGAKVQLPGGQIVPLTDAYPLPLIVEALKENCCCRWSDIRDFRFEVFSFDGDLVALKEQMESYTATRNAYRKREAENAAMIEEAKLKREREALARRLQSEAMSAEVDEMFRNSLK